MIRRKISLLLAILMVITTMTVGFTPTAAGSDDGITTDTPAPYDEYEEIRKLKQKDQTDPENNEPQQIVRESLYTKTVDNGDGTKTLEVYGEPVRYEAKDGSVKDISLKPVAKGKGFTTGDHRLGISFPEKADSGISLDTGEYVITATPVAENGTAVKTASACLSDTDAIVYRSDPKTSYEYSITYSGYKENIVVSEYTGQTDYYFRIETDGLLLVASEGDPARGAGLELKDTEGRTAARIGNIIIFSSDNRNNTFGSVGFETVTERDEYIIRISVPEAYLSDPATHYPIYIDPTITVAYNANNSSTWNDIEDITVNQNQAADPPNYGTLYVGKAGPDYGAMRAVMRFPELELYGISPNSITSAKVYVRDLMCYGFTLQVDCYGYGGTLPTGAFTTSNMTWSAVYNTMQYYESNNVYRSTNYVSYNNGYADDFWYEFNVLPAVQSWAQGRNAGTLAKTDQAIVFKATDTYEQSTSEQYVCFGSYDVAGDYKPYLTITYIIVNSVVIQAESTKVLTGSVINLVAITSPTGLPVTWRSSNTNIATVSQNGVVTGVRTGVVTITAQCADAFDTCTISVVPLEDGVYRIQNLDNFKYLTDGGGAGPILSNLSSSSRNQMWLVKNVSGTTRYTLNPLSCTTVEYSGTDYGLIGGYEENDTGVFIDSISNGSASFAFGEWFISGNAVSGYRIVSYAADDYDIMVRNSSGNGVELEYEEDLMEEEDPVDLWNITFQSSISYTSLSSSVNSLSSFQSGKLNWLPFIASINSNAADQRATFHSLDSSKVAVSQIGIITVYDNCPGNSSVLVNASCGNSTVSITVSTLAYGAFSWNSDYYVENGRINMNGRIVWLDKQDNQLLSLSGSSGLSFAAYNDNSFNHEWRLLGTGDEIQLQNVVSDLVLKVQSPVVEDGSSVALSTKSDSIGEYFRFERIENGNRYIITTKSSGYTCALAYNSNTGSIYQANRINTQQLLKFRIREGGSSTLPSGYYCMGNPYGTSYFYLTADTNTARLDSFSETADYPRWLLIYKGNGYYSIVDEPGVSGKALTYNSGNVSLVTVTGNDNQSWECISNICTDSTYSFKSKVKNANQQHDYLMRDASLGSFAHPVVADSPPVSTEANWKMIPVKYGDAFYNYGIVADVALIGIADTTHDDSHLLWIAEVMDKLYNRRNTNPYLYYESHTVKYLYSSATQITSSEYYDVLKFSKFVIHFGHGQIDHGGSYLMLNPTSTGSASNNDVTFSASSISANSLNNCDCIIFFSCKSAGAGTNDFSTSMVKKAADGGAKYAIGCLGDGYCDDFEDFIDYIITNLELKTNTDGSTEPNYQKAFSDYGDYLSSDMIRTRTIFKDSNGLTAGGIN